MKLKTYKLICCLLLTFVPLLLMGQKKDNNFRFEKFPEEIGFYNTGINDIVEDHRGFLWMATWSGLAKYDGYNVKMYRQQLGNTNGLKTNKITQIFEDRKKNLWIGTNYTGFYRYNRDQDFFEQFCNVPADINSLSNNNVWAIFEDSNEILWIGTEEGLNRFDPKNGTFHHYKNIPGDNKSISHDFVYSITETPDGSLWIGTEEGLNRLIRSNGEEYFIRYNLTPEGTPNEEILPHNFIYKIIPSRFHKNTLWLCTSIGLKKIIYSTSNLNSIESSFWEHNINDANSLSHPFVSDIFEENEKDIWVATYNGLNYLNTEKRINKYFTSKKNVPFSLSSNVVMCLTKDHSGNLWVGMDNGINKLNLTAKAFQNIRLHSEDNTNSATCMVYSPTKKGVWIGSRGGGLNFLPSDSDNYRDKIVLNYQFANPKLTNHSGFIFDVLIDKKGWLWIATDGAGIFRVKESNIPDRSSLIHDYQQLTKSDQLSEDYVMSINNSVTGDIWVGYWDVGIDRYDSDSGVFHHYSNTNDLSVNLEKFPIVHLVETIENGQNFLWAGTRGGGIYKLKFVEENDALELEYHFNAENGGAGSLSNNFINSFLVDKQNRLWVGTDSGLNLLDNKTGKFTSYFEEDGLKNGIIQSILEDSDGKIWVSTQQGVSCLFEEDGIPIFKNFDSFDGLQDNFFNDDAAVATANGHLIFGGINGLSLFKPGDIQKDTISPKVAITDFRIYNESVPIGGLVNGKKVLSKSISETTDLELTYRENVISFEFTGLHFGEPKKNKYAYQLQGFDPGWIYTDASQRIAHYTNLPYKDFVFKVKAANGDGAWSDPVELRLNVLPPFWLTHWAYSFYFLVALGLIYLGIRITKLRAEFRHSLELERVEREKLEEINNMKLQFFTNISHELRTPLTLIISPLEQLLQQKKDKNSHRLFTRMHYNANRLLTMINQLLDIRKSEAGLMKMHVAEGDIVAFSKEIISSFKNLAEQRDINLRFTAKPEKIKAWFDHEQLEKVLFNLLSNAFKFTKDNGKVEVKILQTDSKIQISITDTGVGIPASQLENIFQRFYQVENNKKWNRKSGTGIGLSLAKMIIEKHHGEIKVESKEDIGTTFILSLNLGKAHFSESELLPVESTTDFLTNITPPEKLDVLPPPSKSENIVFTQEKSSAEKPLILLVEDNADIRSYLRENLEIEYRISEAKDGIEGLEKAFNEPPSLIIADIAMPKMDGIEMCAKIKSNIETSHIPVILLTARTSLIFKVDGLETGADDYVTKPFHMRLLIARVKNLINSRKLLQKHFSKNFDFSPSSIKMNSLDEKLLSQIKIVIEKHIDDSNFSVDQLATSLNMSRMKLYRKLKSLTGKSPNQLIRNFRLQRAVQLLETGQYNISDVTYMVGYNDLKSFREQFKKEFGVSPSGYTK